MNSMRQKGFTLIEVLLATAISAVLVLALGGLVSRAISVWQYSHERQELLYQGNFAITRIIATMRAGQTLITPADNTPGNILSVVKDVAVDPTPDPFIYHVVGSTALHETIHGVEHIIAEAANITFQVQQITPPGANTTQVGISITLDGVYSDPLTVRSEVMLGVGS